MRRAIIFLFTFLLISLAACGLLDQSQTAELDDDTSVAPDIDPTNTPEASETPDVAISAVVTSTQTSLTIWVPPEIWESSEAGQLTLLNQLDAYQALNPEIEIHIEPKAVSGQGSLLNYLRSGKNIAPEIIPDLVALPTEQLPAALDESLVVPLDSLIDEDPFAGLYSAGLTLVTHNDQLAGYPFVISAPPHLAYVTTITESVPLVWDAFINLPDQNFAFPAAGPAGATLLLELYLDAGGTLVNEEGSLELQLEPMALSLEQLKNGLDNEFILPESSDMLSIDDTWAAFDSGSASFVQTSAEHYLPNRGSGQNSGVSSIPGIRRPLNPLVSGWAWSISTADSNKRAAVADLLLFLVNPENLGEWSYQSQLLPADQESLFFWPDDDPYVGFASEQLLVAEAHPFTSNHPVMIALSQAVQEVITGSKSPQAAAEDVIATFP